MTQSFDSMARRATALAISTAATMIAGGALAQNLPCLTITPAALSFGNVAVGEEIVRSVTLESCADVSEEITASVIFGLNASSFSVRSALPATLGPRERVSVAIAYSPAAAGAHQAAFAVMARSQWRYARATLPLSGTGVALAAPSLADTTWLDSIPRGPGTCWYTYLSDAIATDSAGVTWLAASQHRACDTRVDVVTAYRHDGAQWTASEVHRYDYSGSPFQESWGKGIPGFISLTLDSSGQPHIVFERRAGGTAWEPGRGFYVHRAGGQWQTVGEVFSDESIQIAQGNSAGARYSGFTQHLAFDPARGVLEILGHDGAWFTTNWNTVSLSVMPGSTNWPGLSAIDTRNNGTIDRGAIGAESQDFAEGAGVQVWLDKHNCRVIGREISAGSWGSPAIDLPLDPAPCNGDPWDNYGFNGTIDVLQRNGAPEIYVVTASPVDAHALSLYTFRRNGTVWTSEVDTIHGGRSFAVWGKVFADAFGRRYLAHKTDDNAAITLLNLRTKAETIIHSAPGRTIQQLDVSRHDPSALVWTETDATTEYLYAARLMY
jgi:hypothetical protein